MRPAFLLFGSAAAAALMVVSMMVTAVCAAAHVATAKQQNEDHNEPQASIILKTHIFHLTLSCVILCAKLIPIAWPSIKSYPSAANTAESGGFNG